MSTSAIIMYPDMSMKFFIVVVVGSFTIGNLLCRLLP